VHSAATGRAISYWVLPQDWLFLRTWEQPRGFPRWIDWPRFFHVQEKLLSAGANADISPLLQASELRRVLEEILPVLEAGDMRTEFKASRNDTGTEFTVILMQDIEGLYAGL
jgi:hypothetical protein